ncbi:MAG: HPr kinase/phosphorylase [Pseudolabrys sp.]
MTVDRATVHASAVLIGRKAALIRGPSGSGKSNLVWGLLQAATQTVNFSALPFARLVADDRVHIQANAGRLLVRPAPALAGMIEIRGLGIWRLVYEPLAAVGLVVDLAAEDSRYPDQDANQVVIEGIALPRIGIAIGIPALPMVLAFLLGDPTGN